MGFITECSKASYFLNSGIWGGLLPVYSHENLVLVPKSANFLPPGTQLWKVTMARDSDVKLQLGFHCVVNRSQKNIEEGMTRTELWKKEGRGKVTESLICWKCRNLKIEENH